MTELQTKRETLTNTARSLLNKARAESRALTAAEQKDYDGLLEKIEALNQTLKRAQQLGELRAEIERPIQAGAVIPNDGGMQYVHKPVREGEVRLYGPNERIAAAPYNGPGLGALVRGMATGNWKGAEELRTAMAEGAGATGGFLVPSPLSNVVIDLIRNETAVIRAGAMTVPMEASELKMARQSADVACGWKSENATFTYGDAAFEQVKFTAQMLIAGAKLSIELVEDAPNIDQLVGNSIGRSLALELDRVCLYGSGSAPEPAGIKNTTNVITTDLGEAAGYTLIDYSKFSAAIATLMGYNFRGPFSILYSSRTAGELDNLQDTLHQPLRQPDLVAAARKFVTNQIPNDLSHGSASTASDAFVGQFSECMIGMRTSLSMEVSRVAADAVSSAFTNAQVWIRAYLRADVQLAHPKAFNVLTGIL